MTVLDSHCDTPSEILRLRDISLDNEYGHVDVPKLLRSGVDATFFALYTPASMAPDRATAYALEMLSVTKDAIAANPEHLAFASSRAEIEKNKANGLVSILLGMENASPIQKSLPLLFTHILCLQDHIYLISCQILKLRLHVKHHFIGRKKGNIISFFCLRNFINIRSNPVKFFRRPSGILTAHIPADE